MCAKKCILFALNRGTSLHSQLRFSSVLTVLGSFTCATKYILFVLNRGTIIASLLNFDFRLFWLILDRLRAGQNVLYSSSCTESLQFPVSCSIFVYSDWSWIVYVRDNIKIIIYSSSGTEGLASLLIFDFRLLRLIWDRLRARQHVHSSPWTEGL